MYYYDGVMQCILFFFFFKQKTAYEMRISDWSSDVCSSDLHWIDDHIATPMARYPEYRASRQSFGINVLGTLVVEIEAEDGTVGFAVTTGGEPACFIVERHLARFLIGRSPTDRKSTRLNSSHQCAYRMPSSA